MMKLSWSVFSGPALDEDPARMKGPVDPRLWRAVMTVSTAARGSTSMGMVGQWVRRRGCNFRWSGQDSINLCYLKDFIVYAIDQMGSLPATQINFRARVATSFSWYRHAPPPFIQFRSSSISSAPSKATSRRTPRGSESKAIGVKPARTITCRDW